MSKLCQGPSCHMYDTTDRKRGPKETRKTTQELLDVMVMVTRTFVLLIVRMIGGLNMEHEQLNTLVS